MFTKIGQKVSLNQKLEIIEPTTFSILKTMQKLEIYVFRMEENLDQLKIKNSIINNVGQRENQSTESWEDKMIDLYASEPMECNSTECERHRRPTYLITKQGRQ